MSVKNLQLTADEEVQQQITHHASATHGHMLFSLSSVKSRRGSA